MDRDVEVRLCAVENEINLVRAGLDRIAYDVDHIRDTTYDFIDTRLNYSDIEERFANELERRYRLLKNDRCHYNLTNEELEMLIFGRVIVNEQE